MKVSIDDSCIGCGVCVEICPQVFEMEGDVAKVINPDGCAEAGCCEEAAESCPTESIKIEE